MNELTVTTPADLLQMAVSQGADLDKMEKLMDLQGKWEASEARKAFNVAMAEFRGKAPTINKNRSGHNTKYAGLAETLHEIKGILNDCKLSVRWGTNQEGSQISVTCFVTHIQGHEERTTLTASPDTSGSKNSIQAIGSTVSYLERYTLYAILGLASADMDDDAVSAVVVDKLTDDQAQEMRAYIEENEINEAGFIQHVSKVLKSKNTRNIEDIPEIDFKRMMSILEVKAKTKKEAA